MFELAQLTALWESAGIFGKVILALLIIHPVASAIVAATPTPKDDKWYGQLYAKVVEPLALNIFRAKEQPKR